jgi:uncharacterized protein
MRLERKDLDLEIKLAGGEGRFAGHGSIFGLKDSDGDIVAPGAFTQSLSERKAKGRPLPILWQHKSSEPLGVYDVAAEDGRGLYLEGRLLVDAIPKAREAFELLKCNAITGLSIGYRIKGDSYDTRQSARVLTAIELHEVSLVTFPAADDARVESIKSIPAFESMRGAETWLRDALGLTSSESKAFVSQFKRALIDPQRAEAQETQAMTDYLSLLRGSSAITPATTWTR